MSSCLGCGRETRSTYCSQCIGRSPRGYYGRNRGRHDNLPADFLSNADTGDQDDDLDEFDSDLNYHGSQID